MVTSTQYNEKQIVEDIFPKNRSIYIKSILQFITIALSIFSIESAIYPISNLDIIVKYNNHEEIPKAYGFQEVLDPTNETMMTEFTKQYVHFFRFPNDRQISTNISYLFEKSIIKKRKSTMDLYTPFFISNNFFHQEFIEAIKYETEKINVLTKTFTSTLKDVCTSFVKTTDPNLPIPLYKLFNSAMSSKLDRLKEVKSKLVEQKEREIIQKKIEELKFTSRPRLTDILQDDVTTFTNSISDLFYWSFFSKKSQKSNNIDNNSIIKPASPRQIYNSYIAVDEDVKNQILELNDQLDINVFNEVAREVYLDLEKQTYEVLSLTNIRIYLTAVCQIQRPVYIFNHIDGLLYIKDPIKSRSHLKILAQNVLSYYPIVIKELQLVVGEERFLNMKSLLEKSQSIIEILTYYDTELSRSLIENDSETDYLVFFENIADMFNKLNTKLIETIAQFPITEREKLMERTRQKEITLQDIRDIMQKHDDELQLRSQILENNQVLNNLSEAEWNVMIEWISLYTEGALKMGTGVVINVVSNVFSSIINVSSDIGNTVTYSVIQIIDNGLIGIETITWRITKIGMIVTIPTFMIIYVKSRVISTIFHVKK